MDCFNSLKKLKMALLPLLLLGWVLSGCASKSNLTKNKVKKLTATIDSMYKLDQGSRVHFFVIDSIYGINGNAMLISDDEKNRKLGDKKYVKYRKSKDSILLVMQKIDTLNTIKLLELTKKYGFPSNERLGQHKAKAYFIFVHSPSVYFNEIRKVILEEFKLGRISEYKKEYIFWHLNGRNSMPPMSGKNGEVVW